MGVRRGKFESIQVANPARQPIQLSAHIPSIDVGADLRWQAKANEEAVKANTILYSGVGKFASSVCNLIAKAASISDGFDSSACETASEITAYRDSVNAGATEFDASYFSSLMSKYKTQKSSAEFSNSLISAAINDYKVSPIEVTEDEATEEFTDWGGEDALRALINAGKSKAALDSSKKNDDEEEE